MKFLFFVLPVLYLLSIQCGSVPETGHDYISVDTSRVLEEIIIFKDIISKREGDYKRVIRNFRCRQDTGKLVALFTASEEIKKITLHSYKNSGKKNVEYFFRDNDYLIYVREMHYVYHPGNPQEPFTTDAINEFYFSGNNLFLWKLKDHKINPGLYLEKSKEIFSYLEEILTGLQN